MPVKRVYNKTIILYKIFVNKFYTASFYINYILAHKLFYEK